MTSFDNIAEFVFASSDSIPDHVMSAAATLLVDTVGVAAGASELPSARIARDTALHLFQAPPAEAVPLMFDGRLASKAGAAFAGATQIDNLDAHDGYNPTKGHIGCAVVPALFSLAASQPELSGREALAAMVIGYEVATRAGVSLHATVSDYHTSGAWNALGVAAMGCRLAGASSEKLRHALGIAEYHGPRSQMMREIATPTMLHDGSGMGAMIGVMSSEMALRGFEGAPAITVEADDVAEHWEGLGSDWTVQLNYIKPYPICRWAHAALDAIYVLRQQQAFSAEQVASISVRTFKEAAQLFSSMPDTTSKAQYSLKFAVAQMLKHGRVGAEHISGDALTDPETAELLKLITIVEDARHSDRFPASRWSDVTVQLKDGLVLDSGDVHARGGPEAPMTNEEIKEKFASLCAVSINTKRSEKIFSKCKGLLDQGAKFHQLSRLITPSISEVIA